MKKTPRTLSLLLGCVAALAVLVLTVSPFSRSTQVPSMHSARPEAGLANSPNTRQAVPGRVTYLTLPERGYGAVRPAAPRLILLALLGATTLLVAVLGRSFTGVLHRGECARTTR